MKRELKCSVMSLAVLVCDRLQSLSELMLVSSSVHMKEMLWILFKDRGKGASKGMRNESYLHQGIPESLLPHIPG